MRWDDLVRGPQHIDEASQSDPVLVRADGSYLYSFTSVVDDIAFAITHVIRGEDHVTNSAAQIQIFRALDSAVPAFAHLPLLVDAQGGGLSKRTGSLSISDLRERGIEALAISALLARLGTADPVEPVTSLDALVATVDFSRVRPRCRALLGRGAGASQRPHDPRPALRRRARAPAGRRSARPLWLAVRGNLTTLADAQTWAEIVDGPLAPVLEDPSFLGEAASRLPPEPWGETTWKEWTAAVSAATQRKGGRCSIRSGSPSLRARPGRRWPSSCR